jgi:NAD(P)-dependent dehydrogenase (short-subunit alcohol dehydrogenase family)
MTQLENKSILITGASRGLGRALAETSAKAGAKVVLLARPSDELAQAVATIRQQGAEAHALPADLGDLDRLDAVAAEAAAMVGPIEVLIHNASTLGPTPLPMLIDLDRAAFERVLHVNLLGPQILTRAIAGSMVLRRSGLILAISSDAAV